MTEVEMERGDRECSERGDGKGRVMNRALEFEKTSGSRTRGKRSQAW